MKVLTRDVRIRKSSILFALLELVSSAQPFCGSQRKETLLCAGKGLCVYYSLV